MGRLATVFKFKPFSKKQLKILTWWLPNSPVHDCDGIMADGSIRSGKTLSMSLSFVMWAMETFNGQNFAMCGKTIGAYRRNVLVLLKQMLASRGYVVVDHRADNLIVIKYKGKENSFYLFGGKDERSQDLIQGATLAGVLFDEVALMPESFVTQAVARISVEGAKLWFNCNPAGPQHWFKTGWIDKATERNFVYLHFTMDDNLSLSDKKKAFYKSQFQGAFYKRYILGLWAAAEGLIYDMFDMDKHVVKTEARDYIEYMLSCDYGTQNAFSLGLWGYFERRWYRIDGYYYSGRDEQKQKTDEQYYQELVKFVGDVPVKHIIIDPSAASFIACIRLHNQFIPIQANNDVVNGILYTASLISMDYIRVNDCNKSFIKEVQGYCWDTKSLDDKPIKENDHAMDDTRYFCYTHIKRNARKYGLHMVGRKAG